MASDKQRELFDRLTTRHTFPSGTNLDQLRRQFAELPEAEASRWIERALELPKGEDSGAPVPY